MRVQVGFARIVVIALTGLSLAGCSALGGPTGSATLAIAEATETAPAPSPPIAPQVGGGGRALPVSVLSYADTVGPSADVERLMTYYAAIYSVPLKLVRSVVARESNFNPKARNGRYWGLMQIAPATARTMGYRGPAEGLLDPDTNLRYAVKYLAGAYMVARGDEHRADHFYRVGFYYDAKRMGLLEETGLKR